MPISFTHSVVVLFSEPKPQVILRLCRGRGLAYEKNLVQELRDVAVFACVEALCKPLLPGSCQLPCLVFVDRGSCRRRNLTRSHGLSNHCLHIVRVIPLEPEHQTGCASTAVTEANPV
jgi:hypothetical protein